ncbi:MAG TPA: twin-arginine translocation signal domain-containing protein [Vicinamibacterales bacterium]|nr:twin-arginine translocation signal domain-containing protein [Vicinamibacterales bacterium]
MSKRDARHSRRNFLKTAAGASAGAMLVRDPLWAQSVPAGKAAASPLAKIHQPFMITPKQALDWNVFKAGCGPTYAGSTGWKRYTDFLVSKMPEFGAVDLDYVEIPYDHYIVEDWPDRRTHMPNSPNAVEKLVTDGTPVPVVASYGMTSGSTPPEGVTAQMLYYDPAHPPAESQITGRILVFQTQKQPAPPYTNNFLDNYTPTDYEWRSPGKWPDLFTPPPLTYGTSFRGRWEWSQVNRFAEIGLKGHAAGIVIVYDLSPAMAFGLVQRSVYTENGRAGLGTTYVNCPTLTLDRVNGAKVLADAKAGKMATLTLRARFQRDTGKAIIAYLPGKNYGTAQDEQVLLATHTDAMSLIEENGGLGMLGIMSYWNRVPKSERPRTLIFYFDCRHFMPGAEASWPQYDYYRIHPDKLKTVVATVGMEHMGGRQTIETGPGNNTYAYSTARPEDGGVITSLMDVNNNNIWMVEMIARAATDNHWPRVDVKAGPDAGPGVNGGFQGRVKSPMNKGRDYKIPGCGLAGDWPGAWTQTFAQVDTEAGPHGFDEKYFVAQVAGLSQIAGEFMHVNPRVIDLGWGQLKTAIAATKDGRLLSQYVDAFRKVEAGKDDEARSSLRELSGSIDVSVGEDKRAALHTFIETQLSKLT